MATTTTHLDPVCGMTVEESRAAGRSEYEQESYFFCSAGCKKKFDNDPALYLTGEKATEKEGCGSGGCGCSSGPTVPLTAITVAKGATSGTAASALVTDPVCGMQIDPAEAAAREVVGAKTYYFCSASCAAKFKAEPKRYLEAASKAESPPAEAKTAAGKTEYTCPMHPEIIRDKPGSCPICGMALELRTATLSEDHAELDDMTRRFWVCVALTVP
ncbi:MAG: YHS domain-containing protein, partial [Acidobacteriota bacterium]|nr:YHS domain-containing protein [Acidobacteriota bacterium]